MSVSVQVCPHRSPRRLDVSESPHARYIFPAWEGCGRAEGRVGDLVLFSHSGLLPRRSRVYSVPLKMLSSSVQGGAEGMVQRETGELSEPQRPQPIAPTPPRPRPRISGPRSLCSPLHPSPGHPAFVVRAPGEEERRPLPAAPGLGKGALPPSCRAPPASPGLVSAGAAARASPDAPSSAGSPRTRALPAALSTLYLLPRHVASETRLDFGSGRIGARIVQRDVENVVVRLGAGALLGAGGTCGGAGSRPRKGGVGVELWGIEPRATRKWDVQRGESRAD